MPRKVIGLDPGSRYFKAVELECGFRAQEVTGRWRVARSGDNANLRSFVSKTHGNGKLEGEVWTALPLTDITARLIRTPFSNPSKIEKVAPYELESHVPFGVEEMVVDHQLIERDKATSWILAAGVRRESVETKLGELGEAGLNPKGLVPEGHAYRSLARFLDREEGPRGFLDIGATHSVLAVGLGERIVASRSLHTGADDITKALSKRLSLPFDEAERLKVEGGIEQGVLLESAREALEPLACNVSNSIRFIAAEEGIYPAGIFLCGGGALTPGISLLLTELIGVPCELLRLPEQFGDDLDPQYAHALALALEDIHPVHGVNFRKGEFAYRSEAAAFREKLFFPALLLFMIIFMLAFNSLAHNQVKKARLATLKAQVASVVQGALPGEEIPPSKAVEKLQDEIDNLNKLEENLGALQGLTPLELLTAISELIPPNLNVDLEKITLTDRMATLEGIIPEHSDMDVIVENLKNFSEFKRFDTPSLRTKVGGGVKFTLKIFLTEDEEND